MKILKKFRKSIKTKRDMSKNSFFITVFTILLASTAYAQTSNGIGIKGGLNYNANGDYFASINDNAKNPDRNVGYHFGLFGKIGNKVYLRPEVVYSSTKSDYDDDSFKMQKIDAPILVGIKVLGPLSVFAGPSFQYILDSEFEGVSIKSIKNDFTVGANFGIALNLKKVGIDLRYERGFNKNEATFINNNIIDPLANNTVGTLSKLDTRPDQLILSLSLLL